MVKTAIARYLARCDSSAPDYIEVKDSSSVVKFCTRYLSNPSHKNGIQTRIFTDMKPEIFLQRKEQALDKITTIAGISRKYQYVCEVILLLQFFFLYQCF